jgi:hypothetical protein
MNVLAISKEVFYWCIENDNLQKLDHQLESDEQIPQVDYPDSFYCDVDGVSHQLFDDRCYDRVRYLVDTVIVTEALGTMKYNDSIYALQIVRDCTNLSLHMAMIIAKSMYNFIGDIETSSRTERLRLYQSFSDLLVYDYDVGERDRRALARLIGADTSPNQSLHIQMYLSACETANNDLSHPTPGTKITRAGWFRLIVTQCS